MDGAIILNIKMEKPLVVMEIPRLGHVCFLVTKSMAQWWMEKPKTYGNSTMTNFMARCSKSPGASTDLPGRLVHSQVNLVAWCFS